MNCPKCNSYLHVDEFLYFRGEACINPQCFDHCYIHRYDCCATPHLQVVKYIISNGRIQVREQCTNCGTLKGQSLGGYTAEQKEALPPVNKELHEQSLNNWEGIHNYRTRYLNKQRQIQSDVWNIRYAQYLQTDEWKQKREMVMLRDKYLCQCCMKNAATQVHHKSYEFVDFTGLEPCFDLVAICKDCHEKLHEARNNRKAS